MKDETVLAIASGMKKPKKEYNPFNQKNLYLNYGLLGLATLLKNKGYKTKMFQGDYIPPADLINTIENAGINLHNLAYPVLLSIPSYFSLPWAKEFCTILKEEYSVKIVVGGRWVVGDNEQWLRDRLPQADLVVPGLGEGVLENILNPVMWKKIEDVANFNGESFKELDFSLLHNFQEYQPCIEVSRGCGRGCFYCVERKVPLTDLKRPEDIIEEMHTITQMYSSSNLHLYFQASIFKPDMEWAVKLKKLYKAANLTLTWRCETRVDSVMPEIIKELAEAGLKVIDFGLESASLTQLKAMGKTSKPTEYLERAQQLLRTCKEVGIWVKMNVLLFAGETVETFNETVQWLNKHKDCIQGISVNPLILYSADESYIGRLQALGAHIADDNSLQEVGFSFLDLSAEMDYRTAVRLSMNLSKSFMTMENYFNLKSFSYFPRSYTFDDYKNEIGIMNRDELPFTVK